MAITKERFGMMPDGREIVLYTISNENGYSASFTNLGAIWTRMLVPDRNGCAADVLLGYEDAEGFLVNEPHMGAIVGRVANRTGGASFVLNGKTYHLGQNDGANNLHSGPDYYDKRLWNVGETTDHFVEFTLTSPDGDQGYPGNAEISVTYTLTEANAVEILYRVVCDQDTPVNLTSHGYFNLAGHDSGEVYDHVVRIAADAFTPTGASSVPTGEKKSVFGTPFDFTKPKKIGEELHSEEVQMKKSKGYDHNFCLNHPAGTYALAATVWENQSGRMMEVYTDLPGIQFYTGNWLEGEIGKGNTVYKDYGAFCLETQFFPDSLNQEQFASPILRAGESFVSKTEYRFKQIG